MATRFRKLRTRKMKHRKALKTRKQGGSIFKNIGNEVKYRIQKFKERREVDKMFSNEQKALQKMEENKKRAAAHQAALQMYKKI